MKKILLASTILVGTAGVAAADISWSGEAGFGIATADGGATWAPTISAEATIAMVGTTDGGLEFGAEFTIDGVAGTTGDASAYLSGSFGTVTVSNATGGVDIAYEYTMSSFSVDVEYTWTTVATNGDWDIELGYDFGDYSVYLGHGYDAGTSTGTTRIGGEADFGAYSVGVDINDVSDFANTWELTAGWTSGAVSIDVSLDAQGAGTTTGLLLEAAYDLGGGAAVEASWDNMNTTATGDDTMAMGITMEF